MLSPDRPFGEPRSQAELRSLLLAATLVAAVLGAILGWKGLVTPVLHPTPENLWPGVPTAPASYSFTAQTGQGEVRVWAVAPDKWRLELPDGRIEISTGVAVWQYLKRYGIYFSIPYQNSMLDPNEIPRLVDGTAVTFDDEGIVSTRRPYLAGLLGPTTPQRLMQFVLDGHHHGSWYLEDGEYLGRPVQILHVDARKNIDRNSERNPYTATITIDHQYLFVLAVEMTIGSQAYPDITYQSITEISYDIRIPDEIFVLVPPAGARNCYTTQFINTTPGCP
jgi:outer membrane lipoprotein-sorting protein